MRTETKQAASGREQFRVLLLLVVVGFMGFHRASAAAADSPQTTFASPEAAGQALLNAARAQDEIALAKILGSDAKAILSSGDGTEDKEALESFVGKFEQMNRWVKMTDGSEILNIGADNYPFPIPLVHDSSANWHFNTKAGKDEILARQIGRNELLAIDALCAIAVAEELYAQEPRDGNPAGLYTTKIFSTAGKQDGLYWPVSGDELASPLGHVDLFAKKALSTSSETPIIDGYSFRILTAQSAGAKGGAKQYIVDGKMTGGFAVVAWPVKYEDSGVMTFIVNRDGVVYQKDLGPDTQKLATTIAEYNPTDDWVPAQ